MKILAIESASLVASAAVLEDGATLAEYTGNTRLTHSETLLPMIDAVCRMTGTDGASLDAIAVACGPGSFTGLRIGAATAKGLGMAWNKPLIAVPTTDAMAYGLWGCRFLICPILDARRGQVYTGLYRFDETGAFEVIKPASAMDLGELMQEIRPLFSEASDKVVFLGDGVPVFHERIIKEKLGERALFAPPHTSRQRAAAVGALGLVMLARGETVEADAFAPQYLRVSQAERERAARLAAGAEEPDEKEGSHG